MSKICLVESLTSTGGQSFVVGFEASAALEKVYEMVELGAGVGTPSGACLRMWSGPVLVLPTVFVLPWEASDFGESALAS